MHILQPCKSCGETLIFGHHSPTGDVERDGGWNRVRCPGCRAIGPVAWGLRAACRAWNGPEGLQLRPPPRAALPLTSSHAGPA